VTRLRQPATEHDRLAAALTARDRWILRMLAEHRVLTTTMFVGLAFPSPRAAQLRLRALFTLGVINRFQPLIPTGSAPLHWILDTPGRAVLTAEDHLLTNPHTPVDRDRSRRGQALALVHSQQLAHLLEVNTALTHLAATTTGHRDNGAGVGVAALELWWSQTRCTRHVGDFIHPDAYAHYRHHTTRLAFFYEHDRGSEPPAQLAAKLTGYHDLAHSTAITTPLLIFLPTRTRETTARHALAAALAALPTPERVPIATTSPAPTPHRGCTASTELTGGVWRPLTHHQLDSFATTENAHMPGRPTHSDPSDVGRVSLTRLALRWPHQIGRDHTATPSTAIASPRDRGRDHGGRDQAGVDSELAAPHPIPPAAAPHPATTFPTR
jgi:hypothetical protein